MQHNWARGIAEVVLLLHSHTPPAVFADTSFDKSGHVWQFVVYYVVFK